MKTGEMRYYRGSASSAETIDFSLENENGDYITTCVINCNLLIANVRSFPCGDGDDYTLDPGEYLKALLFVQEQRKAITDRYPVKTYKGWQESGLPFFEDYCRPGDEVDEEMVEYFINSVPPVSLSSNCTQAGETYDAAVDESTGRRQCTYTTFHIIGEGRWKFDGYCFRKENVNRSARQTRLEQMIERARKEAEE